jgi:hypothetical protein
VIRVIGSRQEQDGPTTKPIWSTFVIDAPEIEKALAQGWDIVGVELVRYETADRDHQRIEAEKARGGAR